MFSYKAILNSFLQKLFKHQSSCTKICSCPCTNILSKCVKQNNKVVLLDVSLSSCNKLVQSVVYLITLLPRFYFIVFLTFISIQHCSVSALSHFTGFATEAKGVSHQFGCVSFGLRIITTQDVLVYQVKALKLLRISFTTC